MHHVLRVGVRLGVSRWHEAGLLSLCRSELRLGLTLGLVRLGLGCLGCLGLRLFRLRSLLRRPLKRAQECLGGLLRLLNLSLTRLPLLRRLCLALLLLDRSDPLEPLRHPAPLLSTLSLALALRCLRWCLHGLELHGAVTMLRPRRARDLRGGAARSPRHRGALEPGGHGARRHLLAWDGAVGEGRAPLARCAGLEGLGIR